MTDEKDTKTIDMLPDAPVKRGRPVTGHARTPAQRKATSRHKSSSAAWSGNAERIKSAATSVLLEEFGKCVAQGFDAIGSDLAIELIRRMHANGKKLTERNSDSHDND